MNDYDHKNIKEFIIGIFSADVPNFFTGFCKSVVKFLLDSGRYL